MATETAAPEATPDEAAEAKLTEAIAAATQPDDARRPSSASW